MAKAHALALSGVDLRTQRLMIAARAVLCAAMQPSTQMSVPEIARASGLEMAVVEEILTAPEWRDLFETQLCDLVRLSLGKALRVANEAMDDEKVAVRLDAVSKVTTMYRTLGQAEPKHKGKQGQANVEDLLKQLGEMNALHRGKVQVVVSPPCPSPEAPPSPSSEPSMTT
jgi:hypothetical protein